MTAERYLYERLSEKRFQQLCNALLVREFPDAVCYPVGQKDGGRDATRAGGAVIFQVKWARDPVRDPVSWLTAAIRRERAGIVRLVSEGARSYVLMTSVAGTSAFTTGTMDRLDVALAGHSAEFGIPVSCWWRADIDARVESAPTELTWSFSEMLAGHDAVRYVIGADRAAGREQRLRQIMLGVIATQWEEDSKVKFRQVELDTYNLRDLYVDVEATLADRNVGGAAAFLTRPDWPCTMVRGEPGQGKSTLTQYLCQLHRATFLEPQAESAVPSPRFPLRLDLRDYARWRSGEDPFSESGHDVTPRRQATIEKFLAHLMTARGGGIAVDTAVVGDIISRFPTLIVLDGLDEIAHRTTRDAVVSEIDEFAARVSLSYESAQVVVTTRPNASGLAEPHPQRFETLTLLPLSIELRARYLDKWADARGLRGPSRRAVEATFRERSVEPHIAQLAENPMQLTILLHLIQKRGESIPDGRTQLFTSYMETFLDRESEKSESVHRHRADLEEVTAYLGWYLQARAETDPAAGRAPARQIRKAILNYLHDVEKDVGLVDDLFTAVTDRVWALTSKVQGTFEFDIQTMREYFAAAYLWGYAGADRRDFDKSVILGELVRRPYWLNTCRFFAGFARPNELAALVDVVAEEFEALRSPLQVRVAAWTLLSDGVFAGRPRVSRHVAELFADDLAVRLMEGGSMRAGSLRRVAGDRGNEHLISLLTGRVTSTHGESLDPARVAFAGQLDEEAVTGWWRPKMVAALGTAAEEQWLRCGVPIWGGTALSEEETGRLRLDFPDAGEVALDAGVVAPPGSDLEARLTADVLAGNCSEAFPGIRSLAHDLLRLFGPARYVAVALPDSKRAAPHGAHRYRPLEINQDLVDRLVSRDPGYARAIDHAVDHAVFPPDRMADVADELARLHGPCWLASEITVIAATVGGPFRNERVKFRRVPFDLVSHRALWQDVRRRSADEVWWRQQFDARPEALSRATWCLTLLAVAEESVVGGTLDLLEAGVAGLPAGLRNALAMSSSRIGYAGVGRALSEEIPQRAGDVSVATAMLLAHHVDPGLADLPGLTDRQLVEMAGFGPAGWPGLRALSTRMFTRPSELLLDGLSAYRHTAVVDLGVPPSHIPRELLLRILRDPVRYPLGWVTFAAQRLPGARVEPPLAVAAAEEGWFSLER